jgi:acyl carrier protein
MTREEIKAAVLAALRRVAPELDAEALRSDLPVRDQIDVDSMDFLNFLLEIDRSLGVDVPEVDYHEFTTLDGAITYLMGRAPPVQRATPAAG